MKKQSGYMSGTFADDVMATIAVHAQINDEAFEAYAKREKFSQDDINDFRNTRVTIKVLRAHLPFVKRIHSDAKVSALIDATNAVPDEEIIGNLKFITLPFDRLWLEVPNVHEGKSIGFLIEADKQNGGFSFYTCLPADIHNLRAKICGGRTHVSPNDGIKLDDDVLLTYMITIQQDGQDKSYMIDSFYEMASDLARLFVALNSSKVASNFADNTTKIDREAADKNRRLMGMRRPPILNTTPIVIDMTRTDARLLKPSGIKTVRELLGITRVIQSKLITRPDGSLWLRKKDGMPWSRKEHDRKIETPVDRRDAERVLTASKPVVGIQTFPDRAPQLIIDKSLKPEV